MLTRHLLPALVVAACLALPLGPATGQSPNSGTVWVHVHAAPPGAQNCDETRRLGVFQLLLDDERPGYILPRSRLEAMISHDGEAWITLRGIHENMTLCMSLEVVSSGITFLREQRVQTATGVLAFQGQQVVFEPRPPSLGQAACCRPPVSGVHDDLISQQFCDDTPIPELGANIDRCTRFGGVWQGAAQCRSAVCSEAFSVCCGGGDGCAYRTVAACQAEGGIPRPLAASCSGDADPCADLAIPCCNADGSCGLVWQPGACPASARELEAGDGCGACPQPVPTPPPVETRPEPDPVRRGCCADQVCLDMLSAECGMADGTLLDSACQGRDDARCAPPEPPPPPAEVCCGRLGACWSVPDGGCTEADVMQAASCSPNPCPPPVGVCCDAGECDAAPPRTCPGDFVLGATCDPNPCPQPIRSACCLGEGACDVLTLGQCADRDGQPVVEREACGPGVCGPQLGACCGLGRECQMTTAEDCDPSRFLGPSVACPEDCTTTGACCLLGPDRVTTTCDVTPAQLCVDLGGAFFPGTGCGTLVCPTPDDTSCNEVAGAWHWEALGAVLTFHVGGTLTATAEEHVWTGRWTCTDPVHDQIEFQLLTGTGVPNTGTQMEDARMVRDGAYEALVGINGAQFTRPATGR